MFETGKERVNQQNVWRLFALSYITILFVIVLLLLCFFFLLFFVSNRGLIFVWHHWLVIPHVTANPVQSNALLWLEKTL